MIVLFQSIDEVQLNFNEGSLLMLNVLIGLCVGHDSLFFRFSEAPVTVLVAKDRVMGVIVADKAGRPIVARPEDCIVCGLCEMLCPDMAITVHKKRQKSGVDPSSGRASARWASASSGASRA